MKKFKKILKTLAKSLFYILIVGVIMYLLLVILVRPSNDRNWSLDQKVLPSISIGNDTIKIDNIRDFVYASTTSYEAKYYNSSYPRGSVKKVWYIVEPFVGFGSAHTFLSFEFEDGRFLSISVEIRKEAGESFDVVKGVLRQYELMYVIGSEDDLVKLRSNYRKDTVYVYPTTINKSDANKLFEVMLARADAVNKKPEFYNTLTNTCTTNIVDAVNEVSKNKIPYDTSITFPEGSDYYAYKLGLIDTTLPMDKIRSKYKINDLAEKYATSTNFSKKIRGL